MTYSINASRDHSIPRLPGYLDTIARKKVNGVAIGCIAAFVHWFLMTFSWFYPNYKKVFEWYTETSKTFPIKYLKQEGFKKFIDHTNILANFPDKDKRLHYFPERVGIFDLTSQRIVSCQEGKFYQGCLGGPVDPRYVSIRINNKRVVFNPNQEFPTHPFGEKTDYVVIRNSDDDPRIIKIIEQKLDGQIKNWTVDIRKEFVQDQRRIYIGGIRLSPSLVYVTEDALNQLPNSAIVRPSTFVNRWMVDN